MNMNIDINGADLNEAAEAARVMVAFRGTSVVFGKHPKRALPLMEEGADRAAIRAATGQILGVHDCSLELREGEIVVLMGLSGSGKSTLLRAVNGLNPVVAGDVLIESGAGLVSVPGAGKATLRALRRQRVSMVFQSFGLLPWRSVRENVALGLELSHLPRAERRARAEAQLELVGLGQWADRKVGELSGGMQQRVGLARAFATEAPILLMDEPFSALDPLIRARLQEELLELQARLKRTILFVSHDLDEAFRIGSRIAILEGGRMVQCGRPEEIRRQPANAHVAEFVAGLNPLNVLNAGDAAEPMSEPMSDGAEDLPVVTAGSPLREAMALISGGAAAVRVRQGGAALGVVTAESALRAITRR